MSRDDGFTVADRDTGTLRDPKVVRAYRRAGLAAVVAWDAIVDASWEEGQRVSLEEATIALPYDLDASAILPVFVEVGLCGRDGLISDDSWERWFRPAWERREKRRKSGALGGARSWDQRRSAIAEPEQEPRPTDAEPTLKHRSDEAEETPNPSVRPSVQPPEPSPSPARDGLPNINSTVAGIWESATGHTLLASSAYAQDKLDDFCRRHPPSEVGAAIMRARKSFDHIPEDRALIVAMLKLLDPISREAPRPPSRPVGRKDPAVLKSAHYAGQHDDAPAAGCSMCEGAA